MTEDFLIDLDDELLEEVIENTKQQEKFQAKVTFGQMNIGPNRFTILEDGTTKNVSAKEWKAYEGPGRKWFEYGITVNIQEFSQMAKDNDWQYRRKINNTDLYKIFQLSADELLNVKYSFNSKNTAQTLKTLNGTYVQIADVPQSPGKDGKVNLKDDGTPWTTPKLVAIYGDASECKTAYEKRFGSSSQSENGDAETELNKVLKGTPWENNTGIFIEEAKKHHGQPLPIVLKKMSMEPGDIFGKAMELALGEHTAEYYAPF